MLKRIAAMGLAAAIATMTSLAATEATKADVRVGVGIGLHTRLPICGTAPDPYPRTYVRRPTCPATPLGPTTLAPQPHMAATSNDRSARYRTYNPATPTCTSCALASRRAADCSLSGDWHLGFVPTGRSPAGPALDAARLRLPVKGGKQQKPPHPHALEWQASLSTQWARTRSPRQRFPAGSNGAAAAHPWLSALAAVQRQLRWRVGDD